MKMKNERYCAPISEVISLENDNSVLSSSTGVNTIDDWIEDEEILTI